MTSVNCNVERFHEVLQRHFREPYVAKGMPAEEMSSVGDGRQPTDRLVTSVVTAELHEQFRNLRRAVHRSGASEPIAQAATPHDLGDYGDHPDGLLPVRVVRTLSDGP